MSTRAKARGQAVPWERTENPAEYVCDKVGCLRDGTWRVVSPWGMRWYACAAHKAEIAALAGYDGPPKPRAIEKARVEILSGVEGLAVVINDIRVAGPKAWGGGVIIHSWSVDAADIRAVLKAVPR